MAQQKTGYRVRAYGIEKPHAMRYVPHWRALFIKSLIGYSERRPCIGI